MIKSSKKQLTDGDKKALFTVVSSYLDNITKTRDSLTNAKRQAISTDIESLLEEAVIKNAGLTMVIVKAYSSLAAALEPQDEPQPDEDVLHVSQYEEETREGSYHPTENYGKRDRDEDDGDDEDAKRHRAGEGGGEGAASLEPGKFSSFKAWNSKSIAAAAFCIELSATKLLTY